MPDYEIIEVRSNVDRLSATTVHRLFTGMIGKLVRHGEDFMRMAVPKGETLRLAREVSSEGPHEGADQISAAVGVSPIDEAPDRMSRNPSPDFFSPVAGGHTSRDYPLFVDRGTGVFGPAHAPIHSHTGGPMVFKDAEGDMLFRRSVMGQPASHFMLATFEEMHRVALPADAEIFKERVKHLYLEPNPTI